MDTTGKACVEFWSWAPKKGLVNSHTATALRVAVSQVLGVRENWETLDVTALDTDDLFTRFINLKGKNFTPDSLSSYKSRFNKAISTFLEYSKDPAGWKPRASTTTRREKTATHGNGRVAPTVTPVVDATPPPMSSSATSRPGLVEYPFPLREGRFANLRLPADLTAADVKRLTAFLNTLALEDVPGA
jgi:hypothetical protein